MDRRTGSMPGKTTEPSGDIGGDIGHVCCTRFVVHPSALQPYEGLKIPASPNLLARTVERHSQPLSLSKCE